MTREDVLGRRHIEDLIANGHKIVISDACVLRLDGWLDKHPGGRLVVEHMVGRDATNEIHAYHSAPTQRLMRAYRIGRIEGPWTNFTPPIRGGVFRKSDVEDESSLSSGDSDGSLSSRCGSPVSSNTSVDVHELDAGEVVARKGYTHVDDAGDNYLERSEGEDDTSIVFPPLDVVPISYETRAVQQEIENDIRDYPSLDEQTQQIINAKYQALHQRVKDEGYYDCDYWKYGTEAGRYCILFCLFLFTLQRGWYIVSAMFLGLFWHQIMFTAHDAGHRGITHNFVIDTLIGMFIADFCCGLSIGWWKSSHNVHHLVTNYPEHDPDIQNVPLFATSPTFFKSIHSTYYDFPYVWDKFADIAVQYQKYTYYPVMGIARFNLYLLSWLHLLSPRSSNLGAAAWTRPTEICFMLCYWFLFGYCLLWRNMPSWTMRVAFVLVSHVITMPLHVQITLSHWGTSTADLGETESFPQRQLRTTMDVDCPEWLDFIHGGLQFQAVHHLFPRVPRHNLRKLQVLVREFCTDVGIEYQILNFVDGNKKVLGRLDEIGRQVEMLIACQKYMAETGESGLH